MKKSNANKPIRLIHLADASYAVNKRGVLQIALDEVQLRESRFDALVVTGDIAARSDAASYQSFAEAIGAEGVPVYGVPGDHDDPMLFEQATQQENLHCKSVIKVDNWTILFLDRILGQGLTRVTLAHIRKINQILDANPESPVLLFSRYYSVSEAQTEKVSMESLSEIKAVLKMLAARAQVKALVCCNAYRSTFEEDSIGDLRILPTPSVCAKTAPDAGYRRLDLYADGSLTSDVVHLSAVQQKSAAA